MTARRAALAVLALMVAPALAAASGARTAAGAPTPGEALGSLPATYAGLLPCADCSGLRYQINLIRGGAYMQRTTYLRDGHDDSYYEVGAWSLSPEGRTLTLRGGRRPVYWAVAGSQTLRKLDAQGQPIESSLPYELKRAPRLEPMTPRVRLKGMFRLMADAPRFEHCLSGLEWPVAMSDDYLALERAYGARHVPGAKLEVTVEGRIEPLPRMEGEGTEPTLVVEEFVSAGARDRCESDEPTSSGLEHNRWRPVQIAGRSVTVAQGAHEPWIVLEPKTNRVTGSGGCNRFSGTYQAGEGTVRIGPLASTRMACAAMETETAFFKALDATRRYQASGRTLTLLDDKGKVLARLEERNLE